MPTADTTPERKIETDQICAAFVLDVPTPIRHLQPLWGCRSTWAAWRKSGLEVRTIEGLGPCVIPSEFKKFLLAKFGTYAPRT